ncbi:uncharacterized protein LOC116186720 [Apis dorsata]|uniref:uncharacterized protein LOC116186720 n=1 Tax=Apis dorsata TaxID=7462 RepID=UPI0012936370|nr:uncharacterized protein LOC116186720 [Apis dorsata]
MGYTLNYYIDKRIRSTLVYRSALEIFYNHKKTIEHLGQPIKEGKIKAESNNENNDIKKFSLHVKGNNTTGKLNCEYQVELDKSEIKIKKVEIEFNDVPNKIFVIHEQI